MAKHIITPADSPDVQVEFEIPRAGKAPLEFTVPRIDYSADFEKRLADWAGERMKVTQDGDGADVVPDPISDREAIIAQLRIAGNLKAATVKQIETLTNGELNQIYGIWTEQSKVTVGESEASDS
ncbi:MULTISPECIES: hypothetical protein [Gordonia]|uniref:Tail assembly chaperone n=1 Tax=Gordonia sihwensis NBRC 108236 TaxID=1223544 RepID=L7LIF0_9ACTN|nr:MULTISPECIES: hypothetical protein [Gordonia]AUH68523.1 hypothetical protein CXX93_09360 [Gordonia sp. YC-JH1]KXT55646.1 hypothetical protein Y710_18185 [Gordonia sp. QH-12]GAC60654.1 hypothetical protein GSI01S_10_02490 [Gordonia sihwensis NBRC 108236]